MVKLESLKHSQQLKFAFFLNHVFVFRDATSPQFELLLYRELLEIGIVTRNQIPGLPIGNSGYLIQS